jgi:hypothetical protein
LLALGTPSVPYTPGWSKAFEPLSHVHSFMVGLGFVAGGGVEHFGVAVRGLAAMMENGRFTLLLSVPSVPSRVTVAFPVAADALTENVTGTGEQSGGTTGEAGETVMPAGTPLI